MIGLGRNYAHDIKGSLSAFEISVSAGNAEPIKKSKFSFCKSSITA